MPGDEVEISGAQESGDHEAHRGYSTVLLIGGGRAYGLLKKLQQAQGSWSTQGQVLREEIRVGPHI